MSDFDIGYTGTMEREKLSTWIEVSPEVVSGTPVFRGTRVPVQTLLDHLEAGDSLDVFLEDFPSVTREQAVGLLEMLKETVLTEACALAS